MSGDPGSSAVPHTVRRITPRQLLLALTILGFTIGLAWIMRDFVRQTIVLPLADLAWTVWIGMMSVHQAIWWGLLLLAGLVVTLRSLGSLGREPVRAARPSSRTLSGSRYRFWRAGLEAQTYSPFTRERIRHELQGLVLQVLADQNRSETEEVKARLIRGEIELPPEVAGLFANTTALPAAPQRRWDWRRWFRRPAALDPGLDMEKIISWLEAQTSAPAQDSKM